MAKQTKDALSELLGEGQQPPEGTKPQGEGQPPENPDNAGQDQSPPAPPSDNAGQQPREPEPEQPPEGPKPVEAQQSEDFVKYAPKDETLIHPHLGAEVPVKGALVEMALAQGFTRK